MKVERVLDKRHVGVAQAIKNCRDRYAKSGIQVIGYRAQAHHVKVRYCLTSLTSATSDTAKAITAVRVYRSKYEVST
jgi:hypothetical protein